MSSLGVASILLGAYSHFLPSGAEGEHLYQVIKSMDFSLESQEKIPSVTFMSGESLSDQGYPVLNRVSLIEKNGYDMWLMRQYISPKKILPKDLPSWKNWDFVGILVDRTKIPKTAYYFEFDSKEVPTGQPPGLTMFRASCANCHASGPRVIRPKPKESTTFPLKETSNGLLALWNQKIANYRVVEDYLSDHEATMFPSHPSQSETLDLKECAECHNTSSQAVRGPLRRKHGDSILYLVKNLEMPMLDKDKLGKRHSQILSKNRKRHSCLKAWIESSEFSTRSKKVSSQLEPSSHMKLKKCMAQFSKRHAKIEREKKIINRPSSKGIANEEKSSASATQIQVSDFKVAAKTELTLGPGFEITGIKLSSLSFECVKSSSCIASGKLSLNLLATGIHLRDQHLGSWLKKNRALEWNVRVDLSSISSNLVDKSSLSAPDYSFASPLVAEVSPEGSPSKGAKPTLHMRCKGAGVSGIQQASEKGEARYQTPARELECTFESNSTYFQFIAEDNPCFLGVCVSPQLTVFGSFRVNLPTNYMF